MTDVTIDAADIVTVNAEDYINGLTIDSGDETTVTSNSSIVNSNIWGSDVKVITEEGDITGLSIISDTDATITAKIGSIIDSGVNADGSIVAEAADISGLTATATEDISITAENDIVNTNAEGENVTFEAKKGSIINSGVYADVAALLMADDEIDGTAVTAKGTDLPEGVEAIIATANYIGASSFTPSRPRKKPSFPGR